MFVLDIPKLTSFLHIGIYNASDGIMHQLVERQTSKPKVAGSNPSRGQVEFSLLTRCGFDSLGCSINILEFTNCLIFIPVRNS